MASVLVTGASGFIGRHTLQELNLGGFDIHAVYANSVMAPEAQPGVIWHRADLIEAGASARLMAEVQPEYLLHLAWCAKPGVYWTSPENWNWLRATLDLLTAFKSEGGKHAVLVGSCAEYDWSYGFCREATTPLVPATLYGRSKNLTRELAELFAQVHDLSIAWARIFNAYGPFEAPERLVPAVIAALLRGEPARCSHGGQLRDFIHGADVASALVTLLGKRVEGAFNVGSGVPVSVRTVVEHLASRLNATHLLQFGAIAVAADDPPLLLADNQQLLSLGWRPQFDLQHGLDDALSWWRGRI